jgi:hypothetical protein
VTPAEIRDIPISGRNFLDLSFLIPGVAPTNIGGGTQFFPETSAVPGVGLSIGSQRNLSNNFLVDGLSANDDAAALTGMPYAMDAIDQFQVITSGGQAELGRALAGYINIVTKSGTNRLDCRDARVRPQLPLQRAKRSVRPNAAAEPAPVRCGRGRSNRDRTHLLLRQLRATAARSVGTGHGVRRERHGDQHEVGGGRLSGASD